MIGTLNLNQTAIGGAGGGANIGTAGSGKACGFEFHADAKRLRDSFRIQHRNRRVRRCGQCHYGHQRHRRHWKCHDQSNRQRQS